MTNKKGKDNDKDNDEDNNKDKNFLEKKQKQRQRQYRKVSDCGKMEETVGASWVLS